MLNKDYTAKLLDLEDVIVTNVETISGELRVYLELPRTKHACPACGTLTACVHDYRMQAVKDIPLGRKTLLYLRKRRYRCPCGKRFFEKNSFLPRYHRATSRLVAAIIDAFHELVPASKIGAQYNVSGQPQHDISNTLPSSQPDCRKFSLSTNSRATPGEKSTTALSWTPKNVK